MSPKTHGNHYRLALLPLTAAALLAAGCGGGSIASTGTQSSSSTPTGPAFVIGTDAPMASVVSFNVQIMSITATPTGGGTAVNLMSGTPTVDFARYNGLQTLLDMNDVPQGSYSTINITLGTGTIGYLNTSATPPAIATMGVTYANNNNVATIDLTNPLVVKASSAPVGIRLDFDLAKSIGVDSTGAITGTVTPTFDISAVAIGDNGGYIDEFIAGVVSVNTTGQSFVVQGPHGENFTVNVNGQTEWDGDASLSSLNTNSIVQLSGKLDPADETLDADEVAVLTDSKFYATGQITYVTEATGSPASSFDLYVRALEPTGVPLTLGQIATVNLTGSEKYYIYAMHNPLTNFLFNSSALVAGQDVAIGGPDSGVVSESNVTVNRIHLRNWGFNGTIVNGSENSSQGTFQMQVNGFAGVLIPETITVYLGGNCDFRYGLGAFSGLTDGETVRVVGLLLMNPANGQVVLWARHVDGLDFTDFSTFAF
jgi:hypothetical protein